MVRWALSKLDNVPDTFAWNSNNTGNFGGIALRNVMSTKYPVIEDIRVRLEATITNSTQDALGNWYGEVDMTIIDVATDKPILIARVQASKENAQGGDILSCYEFTRNCQSTVSYSGQTTRIEMAAEINSAFSNPDKTKADLENMYKNKNNPFNNADLNSSIKQIYNKLGFTRPNQAEIQEDFNKYIQDFADTKDSWGREAKPGVAGMLGIRKVNKKGFEINQMATKSTIGALSANNAINYYLTKELLDASNNDVDLNNPGEYTTMEHKWDEAYGYVLDDLNILLAKYVRQLGMTEQIKEAFIVGRLAIVNKRYDIRDAQADIIKCLVSYVLVQKAKDYINAGKAEIIKAKGLNGDAAHDLSEGYGFIYSLQFITDKYSRDYVDRMLKILTKGNGLWDVTPKDLDEIIKMIDDRTLDKSCFKEGWVINNVSVNKIGNPLNNLKRTEEGFESTPLSIEEVVVTGKKSDSPLSGERVAVGLSEPDSVELLGTAFDTITGFGAALGETKKHKARVGEIEGTSSQRFGNSKVTYKGKSSTVEPITVMDSNHTRYGVSSQLAKKRIIESKGCVTSTYLPQVKTVKDFPECLCYSTFGYDRLENVCAFATHNIPPYPTVEDNVISVNTEVSSQVAQDTASNLSLQLTWHRVNIL